jgi:hypothetical protein
MQAISKIRYEEIGESSRPSSSLQRQVSPSRVEALKVELAKMGVLRGEVIDAIRLDSYSQALAEEFATDDDTMAVLHRLVRTRRAEYESKVPELGDLLDMVREQRTERMRKDREQAEREEMAALEADRKANPDNYCTMAGVWAEYEALQEAKNLKLPAKSESAEEAHA